MDLLRRDSNGQELTISQVDDYVVNTKESMSTGHNKAMFHSG